MGYKVVITCDRTMASNYHGLIFLGFSACLPTGTTPDWFYYPTFCPNGPADKEGRLVHANAGMRKVEAALLAAGFPREDVVVAHPYHLDKVVDSDTQIVAITSNDPLGIGPATSTFVELWGGEGRMAQKLRELLTSKPIKEYNPFVFLGGPGAWQLAVHPERQKELGVNCVVSGEGEITAPKLFRKVLDGHADEIDRVVEGEVVPVEQMVPIVGGTSIGLVEVTRGCARSCAFCVPSVRKVRSVPLDMILKEFEVNIAAGNTGGILHGEDVFLYRSDGLKVNGDAVVELFDRTYNAPGVQFLGASHASLSSAVSAPETVAKVSEILELGPGGCNGVNYFQVGIETGSPSLIGHHMKGKVYPYKPEEWPEVVKKGFETFSSNHFVCCATIIMGLPGETPEDVDMTTELIKSLRPYMSIVVPLMFTPMQTTRLEYATPFLKKDLTPKHWELITACWDHNFSWFRPIWSHYGRDNNPLFRLFIDQFIKYGTGIIQGKVHRKARKQGARI